MARQDRKQREFERREREILDAALALCSQPDWESVTVERIAERAEVGKGTVYKHFASKDELLFRLMMRFYRGLLAEMRANVTDAPPREQLRRVIERALRYHVEHREYRYIVEYCDRVDFKERAEPAWRDDFFELDRAFQEWAFPLIQAGMEQGVLASVPVERVMIGIHACFEGAVGMLWAGDDWCVMGDEQTIVTGVTEFILAGLTGQP